MLPTRIYRRIFTDIPFKVVANENGYNIPLSYFFEALLFLAPDCSSQLIAGEKALKGQRFCKILKSFYIYLQLVAVEKD